MSDRRFLRCVALAAGLVVQAVAAGLASAADPQDLAARIDAIVDAKLTADGIPASPRTDDAEFLRRVFLDLIGRVPTYREAVDFLDDSAPDKREKLVDALLARPEYGEHFAVIWRDLIVGRGDDNRGVREQYSWEFVKWLAGELNAGRGWDAIVTDILVARGEAASTPQVAFLMSNRMGIFPKPDALVGSLGQLFLGIQIRCAQCHDHPYVESWKQDDFWGMAAFFGQVRDQGMAPDGSSRKPVYAETPLADEKWVKSYENRMKTAGIIPPRTGAEIAVPGPANPTDVARVVPARFFHGERPELTAPDEFRPAFARWLVAPENPYFAKAAANRLWGHFFARGIVHPVDVMHPENLPSHPELLDLLAAEFRGATCDVRPVIRAICLSRAYQRTSRPVDGNRDDETHFSHMAVKQLDPDVLVDSLIVAYGGTPRPKDKNKDRSTEPFFTKEPGEDAREFSFSVPQFLLMMNAKDRLKRPQVPLTLAPGEDALDRNIEAVCVSVLSRRPTPTEAAKFRKFVETAATPNDGYNELTWILVNSAEFLLNR